MVASIESGDDDGAWMVDANYSCEDLRSLALQIQALALPEKATLFADRMLSCKDGFYSRSFYEAVLQIDAMKEEGRSFAVAARELAGRVPSLENLRVEIDWGEIVQVKKTVIMDFVAAVVGLGLQGPDDRLAKKIQAKPADADVWKLMALRCVDYEQRAAFDERHCREFFEDYDRTEREFAELQKHLNLVKARDDSMVMKTPIFPPWRDIEQWDKSEKGYGFYYELGDILSLDQQSGQVDPPIANQSYEESFPLLKNDGNTVHDKSLQPKNAWVDRASKKTFMNSGIGGKLQHTPPSSPTSEFHIDMSKAMSIKEVWGFALLGQYVGRHPGHFLINAMMKSWGVRSKYRIEEGWMIFYFDSEADQEKVLLGGPYLIQGRPMILKHIPDKFAFNRRDVALVPLWVRIHGLASRFWTPDILGGIASYIGTPLYMDPVTDGRKRHTYARVLVEINLAAPVTRKVPLMFSDGVSFDCTFLVENEPKYCHGCCSFGHDVSSCEFATKKGHVGVKHTKVSAKDPTPKEDTATKFGDASGHDAKDMAAEVHAQDQDREKDIEQHQDQNLHKDSRAPEVTQSEAIPKVDKGETLVEKQASMDDQPPYVSPSKPMEKVPKAQPIIPKDKATIPREPLGVLVANRFAPLAPRTSSWTTPARKNGAKVS